MKNVYDDFYQDKQVSAYNSEKAVELFNDGFNYFYMTASKKIVWVQFNEYALSSCKATRISEKDFKEYADAESYDYSKINFDTAIIEEYPSIY